VKLAERPTLLPPKTLVPDVTLPNPEHQVGTFPTYPLMLQTAPNGTIVVAIHMQLPIKPMLLTSRSETFDNDDFIFEPKWDGWRIPLYKNGDHIEAFTRNGMNVTHRFPELREAAGSIHTHQAIPDCEGVCIRDGRSVFDDFSYRGQLHDSRRVAGSHRRRALTLLPSWSLICSRRIRITCRNHLSSGKHAWHPSLSQGV
jgi:hypothetical protein